MFGSAFNKPQGTLPIPLTGFGSSTTQPAQNTQNTAQGTTPSIFGAATAQPSTSNQATGTTGWGGFGASTNQQISRPSTSGFSGWPTASTTGTASQPSLFQSSNTTQTQTQTQPQPTSFGFPAPSQQAPAQQQFQQSTPQTADFTAATKFNDLPDAVKQQFEQFDAHIQKQIQISDELKVHSLSTEPEKGSKLLHQVTELLTDTTTTLRDDELFAQDLKARVEQTVTDVVFTTRIIEGFRNPRDGAGGYLTSLAGFPFEYFARLTEQMRERLQRYKITVEQIERKLASVSDVSHSQLSPQAISSALRAQHGLFMTLAARTAELEAVLKQLKSSYTTAWRAQTGSARDPFALGSDTSKGLGASRLG